MANYEVTITNGAVEEIRTVPANMADNMEMAEKMVSGLINSGWKVVSKKKEIKLPAGTTAHVKHERYVTEFGCYGYTPIKTGLYEVMYSFGEAVATIIFDKDLQVVKVKSGGKGGIKRAAEIKERGLKKFQEAI